MQFQRLIPLYQSGSSIVSRLVNLAFALVLFASAAAAQRAGSAPEAATGREEKALARANTYLVSAANPSAVSAGLEMLKAGGNAADAAIAVQLVLNLVEPQSSGLGGGAYAMYWEAKSNRLIAYDGRETAPAAAKPDRFLRDGKALPFEIAVRSGLSVGTPGSPRLLEALHRAHGQLPWPMLMEPARKLASEGFQVSSRLHMLLKIAGANNFDVAAQSYFFDSQGSPRPIGYVLRNPEFLAALNAMQESGADAIYKGAIAQGILATVGKAGGDLTSNDLEDYKIVVRDPVCVSYRRHRVCGMPPSSSGGITVGQTLRLLEPFDIGREARSPLDVNAMHLIAEAEKLAFADRDLYIGDPDFVRVPGGLLDSAYLASRSLLISPSRAMPKPAAGRPPGSQAHLIGIDRTVERDGTSHISIIDRDGNALSMTTTIESAFGSRLMTSGFLLNNEMTDFAFQNSDAQNKALANAVGPSKRPRSSMAPTIVFDPDGKLFAVLGSPGGSRIIMYVVKALVAMIDWNMDAQAAASLLNFGARGGAFEIEEAPSLPNPALVQQLERLGHTVAPDQMTSGLQILRVGKGYIEGGADPRREGAALGD